MIDPDRQLAAARELLELAQSHGRERVGRGIPQVVHAGHAVTGCLVHGCPHGGILFLLRQGGHDLLDQRGGVILEHTGRVAVLVAHDLPAGYVLGIAVQAGELHGETVGERHVPVEAPDEYRVIRRDGVDQLMRRQCGRCPPRVVPQAVAHPRALGQRLGVVPDPAAELLGTGRVAQLHAGQRVAAVEEVNVRIVESRHDASSAEVDDLDTRRGQFANGGG